MSSSSVAVLGKGSLAIKIANWFEESPDWNPVHVCPVLPEPDWTASLRDWAATQPGVKACTFDQLDDYDLVFSCYYDRILDGEFIERHGRVLNLHNGPLPRYRGVNPINWALKNDEREHGVTIHEIEEGVDTGPIVSQVRFSIWPEIDEVRDVYERCLVFGWHLFTQTMPRLQQIEADPQNDAEASYYDRSMGSMLDERAGWTRAEEA